MEFVEFYSRFKGEKNVDYVRINFAGDRNTVVDRAVKDEDKTKYKRSWEAYQNHAVGMEQADGIPINQWLKIDPTTAKMLMSHHIYTVEQLAGMTDTGLMAVGPGTRALQNEAKKFLDNQNSEVKALEKKVEELTELVQKLANGDKLDKRTKVYKELVDVKVDGECNDSVRESA